MEALKEVAGNDLYVAIDYKEYMDYKDGWLWIIRMDGYGL